MHVAPLRRCDSHPCDKSRPATQRLNPWPHVAVHSPTRERTQDARISTSSMAKPFGRAADDAVRVQKRERSCAARAVALVHERSGREEMFTQQTNAIAPPRG